MLTPEQREFQTKHINMLAPPSGRRPTLVATLEALHESWDHKHEVRIVEIGSSRDLRPIGCIADGWSTRVWCWYAAQVNGIVYSIDTDPRATEAVREIVGEWKPWLRAETRQGQAYLANHKAPIDLLYMDGPSDADIHLDMYAVMKIRPRLILFDDVSGAEFVPKGTKAIPAMIKDGYELLWHRDKMALLRWAK